MTALDLALLGHGRLGRAIAQAARARGIEPTVVSGPALRERGVPAALTGAPAGRGPRVIVDASAGEAVGTHLGWALELGLPLVIGATGHGLGPADLDAIVQGRIGVLVAPNFASGALLLGRLAEAAGRWCAAGGFVPFLEERHHERKRDAPSGTALWIAGRIRAAGGPETPIAATRAGSVPGTHTLGLTGTGELVEIGHTVLTREAYGAGALAACAFLSGKTGVYGLEDWAREMYPWP